MADTPTFSAAETDAQMHRVRVSARDLPEVEERPSHGPMALFVRGKKCFVMFMADHHGDGRMSIWCAAPPGAQGDLLASAPDRFFRPPYVGHRGWIGVHLRAVDDAELRELVHEAFRAVAPKTLVARWDAADGCEP